MFFLLLYNLDPDKLRQAVFIHCWKIIGICIDWSSNLIWGDLQDPTSFKSFKNYNNYNNNNIINFIILNRYNYIILLSPPPQKKLLCLNKGYVCMYVCMHMLWFNFILGLNFLSLCFKTHYQTLPYLKTKPNKIETKNKMNHSIYNPNPNPNPRKCNYYFYLGLEMCFWDSSCQWAKMARQTHFLYLLLRSSFFQSSTLNTQGPEGYGAGWRVEPPPTTSPGFFKILNLQKYL